MYELPARGLIVSSWEAMRAVRRLARAGGRPTRPRGYRAGSLRLQLALCLRYSMWAPPWPASRCGLTGLPHSSHSNPGYGRRLGGTCSRSRSASRWRRKPRPTGPCPSTQGPGLRGSRRPSARHHWFVPRLILVAGRGVRVCTAVNVTCGAISWSGTLVRDSGSMALRRATTAEK